MPKCYMLKIIMLNVDYLVPGLFYDILHLNSLWLSDIY